MQIEIDKVGAVPFGEASGLGEVIGICPDDLRAKNFFVRVAPKQGGILASAFDDIACDGHFADRRLGPEPGHPPSEWAIGEIRHGSHEYPRV